MLCNIWKLLIKSNQDVTKILFDKVIYAGYSSINYILFPRGVINEGCSDRGRDGRGSPSFTI